LNLAKAMRTTGSPSDSVKNPASVKEAVENPTGPRYGRPSDRFGPPTALFSPELALLRYDLEHLDALAPDSVGVSRAFAFIASAAGFFDDEDERRAELQPMLEDLLKGWGQWQVSIVDGSAKPDGVWLEGIFAYLIVEITGEPGLGGDPFLRSLVVYSKVIAQQKVLSSPCPLYSTKVPQTVSPVP
jgi:hypothetical protein